MAAAVIFLHEGIETAKFEVGEQGDAGTPGGKLEEPVHGIHSYGQESCGVGEVCTNS